MKKLELVARRAAKKDGRINNTFALGNGLTLLVQTSKARPAKQVTPAMVFFADGAPISKGRDGIVPVTALQEEQIRSVAKDLLDAESWRYCDQVGGVERIINCLTREACAILTALEAPFLEAHAEREAAAERLMMMDDRRRAGLATQEEADRAHEAWRSAHERHADLVQRFNASLERPSKTTRK
jgi:hypothetical protein